MASAVELNSTTFRHNPSAAIELEVSTVSLVGEHVAAGFAHRVVSQEVAFGAREQGEAVSLQASRRNHLVPDACVVHVSCEVVFAVDACAEGVGAFAVEAVGFNFADVFNKVIECAHFFFAVVGHCHVSPSALVVGNLLVADDGLVAHFHFEAIVGGDAQFNSAVGCALAEENCILWLVGKNPHFHGERFVVPVAVELGGEHVVFAVETNRNRVVGLCAVANAGHLKVVVGEQAFGNGFVEVQANFVVHSEHAVGRLCAAEQARVIHILDAAVNSRVVINLRDAILACAHSAEVVALVGQVVHKQLVSDCARFRRVNHLGVLIFCKSFVIWNRVVIEALQRNPVFVGTCCRFVLQHYALEVVVVHVEFVERNFHVVLGVSVHFFGRQLGVVGPVVRWGLNVHVGSRRCEADLQYHVINNVIEEVGWVALTLRLQCQAQAIVGHRLAFAHFQSLFE